MHGLHELADDGRRAVPEIDADLPQVGDERSGDAGIDRHAGELQRPAHRFDCRVRA